MTHAKLNNGQLTYFTVGETLQIGESLVTNPSIEMIESIGYKEVIHSEGDRGVVEDGNYIIIETPVPVIIPEVVLTPEEMREKAYETEPVIECEGKLKTCDFIRGLVRTYELLGNTEKVEQLIALWLVAREEITLKYPDYISPII